MFEKALMAGAICVSIAIFVACIFAVIAAGLVVMF